MTPRTDRARLWREPGVAYYVAVCLIALGVILLVMLQRTYWVISLLPILAGVGAGFTSFGPYLLVIVIAVCLNATPFVEGPSIRQTVFDFILCGAVLAYVAGHYRLQGLFLQIFPPDPRRKAASPGANRGTAQESRPTDASSGERPACSGSGGRRRAWRCRKSSAFS